MSGVSRMRLVAPLSEVFGCDLRTLALFRINLGLLIVVDLVLRSRDLVAHYTDHGVLPRAEMLYTIGTWVPSLHLVSGSATLQIVMFLLAAAVGVALLVGYRTRLATLLSWILLLSLQNRNNMLLQGGDMLLLLLLFWGMFLPLGARFSVDHALERDPVPRSDQFFSAATVALLVQCMCVYFFSALLKSDPAYIPDGTAVYQALQLDTYATPLGQWLLNFPTVLMVLTYFVWTLELVGPFAIFTPVLFVPLRLLLMILFIAMHVGFFLCLEIGLFPFVSITSLLTFTPAAVWVWLQRRLERGGSSPIEVYYDGECDFCRKICDLLRIFLVLPGVSVRPAQETPFAAELMLAHYSWVVRDTEGNVYLRWEALCWLLDRSPLWWPLGRVARAAKRGDRFYGWVADHRSLFSGFTGVWLPYRRQGIEPNWVSNVVVAFFLLLVLRANLATVGVNVAVPEDIRSVIGTLRLNQTWNMFAPAPANADRWYVPVARLANGMVVDPRARTIVEPDFRKPSHVDDFFPTYRWRKYLVSISQEKFEAHRSLYASYLCRRWNEVNVEEFHIEELRIVLMVEPTEPDNQPPELKTYPLFEGRCDELLEHRGEKASAKDAEAVDAL